MTIAICAVICGADEWVEVAAVGRGKLEWFEHSLECSNGIPSHDTFGRVFAALDPFEFQKDFANWIQAVSQKLKGEIVTVDGKTRRRSHDKTLVSDCIIVFAFVGLKQIPARIYNANVRVV